MISVNINIPVSIITHTDVSVLSTIIYGLTHNTQYTVNISAITVEPGDAALISFTTPSCKCVIVSMCYVQCNVLFLLVPSLPLNVTVTGGMLRALVVNWQPPSNPGGIITTYMVTYNDITISTTGTMYTIMGLDPFTSYTVSVTACTDNGCGNQTDGVIGTTAEEGF